MLVETTACQNWCIFETQCRLFSVPTLTSTWDGLNTRSVVLDYCTSATLHCQNISYLQNHVLGRRPTTQLASQFHTNHLTMQQQQSTVRTINQLQSELIHSQCYLCSDYSQLWQFTILCQWTERERESRFLMAHQHKNRPFSAIPGKNRINWDNQVNYGKYLTMFNVISKELWLIFIKGNNKIIIRDKKSVVVRQLTRYGW